MTGAVRTERCDHCGGTYTFKRYGLGESCTPPEEHRLVRIMEGMELDVCPAVAKPGPAWKSPDGRE
jgi:hypothetical protein